MYYNQQLEPIRKSNALQLGDLIHQALEAFYKPGVKRGPRPATTYSKLLAGLSDGNDERFEEDAELGHEMLKGYYEEYGSDDLWKVLACEVPFSTPIKIRRDGKIKTIARYVGTIDGVWQNRSNKNILIVDHKTARAIDTSMLHVDEQAGSYWSYGLDWLVQKGYLDKSEDLSGMLYNYLRKAAPDKRPRSPEGLYLNKDGSVSRQQPAKLFDRRIIWRDTTDRKNIKQRIQEQVLEIIAAKSGDLAIYKSPGMFNSNCKACGIRDICELHETGSDYQAMQKLTMQKYDPYENHNKGSNNNGQKKKAEQMEMFPPA